MLRRGMKLIGDFRDRGCFYAGFDPAQAFEFPQLGDMPEGVNLTEATRIAQA